jgi:limonene-1,2-epoxide hydrolase
VWRLRGGQVNRLVSLDMEPEQVVNNFVGRWAVGDVDGIVNFFTDDAVYHNMPMAPLSGHEEIRGFLDGFLAENPEGVQFETLHQVSNGNIVMNERIDTVTFGGKVVTLPVMGVFEVEGDKIKAWRDYFDMAQFTS